MVYEVLVKEPRVVRESGQLCYWIVSQSESKALATDVMTRVHLRSDVMDRMLWQVKCGTFDAINTDQLRQVLFNTGLKAVTTEQVVSEAKSEIFVKPLADTFTFGLYSSMFCGD